MSTQSERVLIETARLIDWYAPGQSQTVVVGDQEIEVRFVARKGRRGRIAITAPSEARFIKGEAAIHETSDGENGGAHDAA